MTTRVMFAVLFFVSFPLVSWAQAAPPDTPKITITKIRQQLPVKDGYIVRYYVDGATPESGNGTGSLHIIYSDKTEIVEKLHPKQKSKDSSGVSVQQGISYPKVADDKRTIAWTEQFDNCCTSYSIPEVLAVYRSGESVVEIQQGQMIWDWMFVEGGKRIAIVWGPVHFSDVGDYQLYDTETGRMIDEVLADATISEPGKSHGLGANAPAWAKALEKRQR